MDMQKWLVSGYTAQAGPDMALIEYGAAAGEVKLLSALRLENNPSFLIDFGGGYFAGFEFQEGCEIAEVVIEGDAFRLGARISVPGVFGLCNLSAHDGCIFGACWGSGHVFAVDAHLSRVLWCVRNEDGSGREPHAHCTVTGPDGYLYCADVGLDAILVYDPADGTLLGTTQLEVGSAPRQMIFSPEGARIFVVNENVPRVDVLDAATLSVRHSAALPGKPGENYPGGACLSPEGLLLVPNRGPDTISVLDVRGELSAPLGEYPCGGAFPRSLALNRAGDTLLSMNQRGGSIQLFHIQDSALIPRARMLLSGASCAVQIQ